MCQCKDTKKCEKSCKAAYLISKKDFCSHGQLKKSFHITKSGKYALSKDISFVPDVTGKSAILIDADNVQLDLCGFTLRQGNDVLKTTGITVLTGHENVTILGSNGTVREFSQIGIYVQGGTKRIRLGEDDSKLNVIKNGGKSPTTFGTPEDAFLEGGIQLGETKYYARAGMTTYHGIIDTATLINCICDENNPVGISVGNGNEYEFSKCSFSYGLNTRRTGIYWLGDLPGTDGNVFAGGLLFLSSRSSLIQDHGIKNWNIDKCSASFNKTDSSNVKVAYSQCESFLYFNVDNINITDSQFNDNVAIGAQGIARGPVAGAGGHILISNSQSCRNTSGGLVEGFHQSGFLPGPLPDDDLDLNRAKSVKYDRCIASNNVSDYKLQGEAFPDQYQKASGCALFYTEGGTISGCITQDNRILTNLERSNVALKLCTGIDVGGTNFRAGIGDSVLIKDCHTSGNTCDAIVGSDISSQGIRIIGSNIGKVSVRDCVITQNSIPDDNLGDRTESGITLRALSGNSKEGSVFNCLITNHRTSGVLALSYDKVNVQNCEISNNEVGVLLVESNCCSALNNTFLHNGIPVQDTLEISTSYVACNKGFDNVSDYDVTYDFGPVPVSTSDLTVGFPALPTVAGENTEVKGSCGVDTRGTRALSDTYMENLKEKFRRRTEVEETIVGLKKR